MSAFIPSTPLAASSCVIASGAFLPRPQHTRKTIACSRPNLRASLVQPGRSPGDEIRGSKTSEIQNSYNGEADSKTAITPGTLAPHYDVNTEIIGTDSFELLRAFIKTRASFDPTQETVFHFSGTVYASPAGGKTLPLFILDGYNICRAVPIDGGGYRLLTREVALYLDCETGKPLRVFENPISKVSNHVVPVLNDPVNNQLMPGVPISFSTLSNENICFNIDVFPRYPTPLPLSEFPDVGSDESMYSSAELFHFITNLKDLQSPETPAVPSCAITWSRIGPWLPWMCMKDEPGNLTYHCRGAKLSGGFGDLPEQLREFVLNECPQFAHAPTVFTSPNETSWSYMRKLINQKGFPRADGRIARSSPITASKSTTNDSRDISKTDTPLRGLTRRELRAFRRVDTSKTEVPIYLCVAGKVFDVSESPEHYGFGETYHCLTGCDATRAFLSGNLSNVTARAIDESKVNLQSISDSEKTTLDGWVTWLSKKYPQVAVLID